MSDTLPDRWELESENILATNMLDTVVPSIPQEIQRLATYTRNLNHQLRSFLPLNRRGELLEYERDLRVWQTIAWRFVHDWVLEGVGKFITESLRILDVISTHTSLQLSPADIAQTVYIQAAVAQDRCHCATDRTEPLYIIYGKLKAVIKRYQANPIPGTGQDSLLATFLKAVAPDPHTSQQDFTRLINMAGQIEASCAQIHTALFDLSNFFSKLMDEFSPDAADPKWAAKLDVQNLRQRWTRLQEEIQRGKKAVTQALGTISSLVDPLCVGASEHSQRTIALARECDA